MRIILTVFYNLKFTVLLLFSKKSLTDIFEVKENWGHIPIVVLRNLGAI